MWTRGVTMEPQEFPRWEARKLVLHDVNTGKPMPFSEQWQQVYWALIDEDGQVVQMISNPHKLPSPAYRNLSPHDFVTAAMTKASEMYEGIGDVSIMSIISSAASGQLLVVLKCPQTFTLSSNDKDGFGTTLVLRNSYKQESGMKVAAGAIRFVCTNGCIFGNCMTLGWNHRNVEDMVGEKVGEVLSNSADKARGYMAELEKTEMPLIQFNHDGRDREWQIRRTFQEMNDRTTMAIAKLPLTWHQQKLVLKQAHQMQVEKGEALTKYDFWNACTAVASHHLKDRPGRNPSESTVPLRRDDMLREINKAFAEKALIDSVLGWDDDTFDKEKDEWITKGWEKNHWTLVGPMIKVSGKKQRDDNDSLSKTSDTSGVSDASESDREMVQESESESDSE